jgi:hypothetical protein
MSYEEKKNRVEWHLNVPFCEILGNIKIHLALIGYEDLQLIMQVLHCSIEDVVEKFWQIKKSKKKVTLGE